jgi:hypothetical protein
MALKRIRQLTFFTSSFLLLLDTGYERPGSGIKKNQDSKCRKTVYGIYQICFSLPEVKKEEPIEPTEAESSNVGKSLVVPVCNQVGYRNSSL